MLHTIVQLRHALHACPERSGQEERTNAILMDFLRQHTTLELHPCGDGSMPHTGSRIRQSLLWPYGLITMHWLYRTGLRLIFVVTTDMRRLCAAQLC